MIVPDGQTSIPRVAVIGAGISGLITARTLRDLGFDVTVFEKSRGLGGRTATRRVDPGLSFDHGAQCFTARDPHFLTNVEAWIDQKIVAEWTGRIVTIDGADVLLKTDQPHRYVGVPGMKAIAHQLGAGLGVRLETRIVRLHRVGEGWQVTDAAGQSDGPFSHVLLSLPAPQAAELLGDHALAAEVRAMPMTPCWAVLAAFDGRVEAAWDGAFVHGSPLVWVAGNSSKPGRDGSHDCWVLHASPDWSAAHQDVDRDTVKATGWLAAGSREHSFPVLPLLVVSFGRSAFPPTSNCRPEIRPAKLIHDARCTHLSSSAVRRPPGTCRCLASRASRGTAAVQLIRFPSPEADLPPRCDLEFSRWPRSPSANRS